jgi:DNA-binding LacI/PurR family transcriptional regulator
MRQPCREIGEVAVQLMAERLAKRDTCPRSVLLPAALIKRSSTARPGFESNQV